jgi:DNA-binding NtrC family response regulator
VWSENDGAQNGSLNLYFARLGANGQRAGRVEQLTVDAGNDFSNRSNKLAHLLAIDPDLAVVMLTAVNDATTASLCLQRGALDYLTKPIDERLLLQTIRQVLDGKPG